MISRNCLNISVSTYLIQMHFPAALILIQKLPLSAMMTDGRAIAICGQMLPGFIEGCCTLGWSEKHKSWKMQLFKADSESRHSTDFRTIFGIMIG